jgi:ATP-dependent exoDNAse (exonuclease V) alpha subunit
MAENIILTPSQQSAFDKITKFVQDKNQKVFILTGYAGTGKTTITKQVIKYLDEKKRLYELCASTGRAAKILSDMSGRETTTIHSLIYKYLDFDKDLDEEISLANKKQSSDKPLYLIFGFEARPKESQGGIYIIDESSMIGDVRQDTTTQAVFGSGRLLSDLMQYDPQGKFIFIGDDCQLPPVTQRVSPALSADYFKDAFNITPQTARLTEIMRQRNGNDIVQAAAVIRREYENAPAENIDGQPTKNNWKFLYWRNSNNIKIVANSKLLLQKYIETIKESNYSKATLITNSNANCMKLSNAIRSALGLHSIICVGDLLLVTQNNLISGLMNGDLVKVKSIGASSYCATLHFVQVRVENVSTGAEYSQLMIADILNNHTVNLTSEQQKSLFIDFAIRMRKKGYKQHSNEFKTAMYEDEYLNALRCVYGYALTCHKAQGGEWDEVFLSPARNITLNPVKANYQWIYTAMTRAKKYLYVADDFFIK